jgi:hypothetical protein
MLRLLLLGPFWLLLLLAVAAGVANDTRLAVAGRADLAAAD